MPTPERVGQIHPIPSEYFQKDHPIYLLAFVISYFVVWLSCILLSCLHLYKNLGS